MLLWALRSICESFILSLPNFVARARFIVVQRRRGTPASPTKYLRVERLVVSGLFGFCVLYAAFATFALGLAGGEVMDFILFGDQNWDRIARLGKDAFVFATMGICIWVYVRYILREIAKPFA
jgi:hypothetical protein